MRRFHFKFEKLLHYRKSQEEQLLKSLSHAQKRQQDDMSRLQFLRSEIQTSYERREKTLKTPTTVTNPGLETDYIHGTKIQIEKQKHIIFRSTRLLNLAFREYFEAKKKRMALEHLREKQTKRYQKRAALHEQKVQDDQSSIRWARERDKE